MTGTGGFLIEASLSGRNAIGIDIHSEMVQGANANLLGRTVGNDPEHAAVKRGDATRLPDVLPGEWLGKVGGFVLDPPYGRNSHGSMANDPLLGILLQCTKNSGTSRWQDLSSFCPFIRWPNTRRTVPSRLTIRSTLLNGEWSDVQRSSNVQLDPVNRCTWNGSIEASVADPSRTMRSSRLSKTMSMPSGGGGELGTVRAAFVQNGTVFD